MISDAQVLELQSSVGRLSRQLSEADAVIFGMARLQKVSFFHVHEAIDRYRDRLSDRDLPPFPIPARGRLLEASA